VINPDGIPQIDGDLDAVATAGNTLQRTGREFAATGAEVNTTWQGLSAFYHAPESGQLLSATGPVQTAADVVGSDVTAMGVALSTYADEVRPIKAELESLRSRAIAFLASIEGDDDWNEDGGKVDEHNGLLAAVNAAVAAWMDAQRRCANTINALYGGIQYVPDNGDGTSEANEFGYSKELLDGATAGDEGVPWGKPEEEDKPWYEDAVGAVVSFGKGLVVDGLWGAVTGLGDMVGLGGWDAFAASWTGLGKLALSLSPGYRLIEATIGTPGPSNAELNQTLIDTGKALIAYDTWDDDPARAAGATVGNIVTAVVGTKGAGAAAKTGTVARVAGAVSSRFPRVAEVAAQISAVVPDIRLPRLGPEVQVASTVSRLDDPLAAAIRRDIDVDSITPTPQWRASNEPLYRLDNRPPDVIAQEGFAPRGADTDLVRYTQANAPSSFVGTSVADDLFKNPDFWDRRFQYEIDAPGGIDVNRTLHSSTNLFPGEAEVAFPGGIQSQYIRGAWELVPNPAGGPPVRGRWIPNPNYVPQ
jgi:hypothetical protein